MKIHNEHTPSRPKHGQLHQLGVKHMTDKSTYHEYMDFYEMELPRDGVRRFLEIGVQGGNSLRAWREWFSDTCVIEGWDINHCDEIDGCDIRLVDQTDRQQMVKNISGRYDIILDDGAHMPKAIETSFSVLFPFCTYYVIEDLHAWWIGHREGEQWPTIELLQKIEVDGWQSPYATADEKEYISKNAELTSIFYRGDFDNPLSMTAIIMNKQNSN